MRRVVYCCPFVPAEWIAAHGLCPSRIMPSSVRGRVGALAGMTGVCPYVEAFMGSLERLPDADAVVFTTRCDQMRRASEVFSRLASCPVFLMHVPTACRTAAPHGLYVQELHRLGRFLTSLGGTAPDAQTLARVMFDYDAKRALLREAAAALSSRRYAEVLAQFYHDGTVSAEVLQDAQPPRGVPLAFVGGPLLTEHLEMFDMVEAAGGWIALNASEDGERTLPGSFDRRRLKEDPIGELADAYFGAIPDAFRRPNSGLYQWLKQEFERRDIRGILFLHYTWCDTWRAEAQRMKEWARLPMAVLDNDEDRVPARTLSRIQSLLEVAK